MSKLLKDLRASQEVSDNLSSIGDDRKSIYEEAADTIEQLQQQLEEAQRENRILREHLTVHSEELADKAIAKHAPTEDTPL